MRASDVVLNSILLLALAAPAASAARAGTGPEPQLRLSRTVDVPSAEPGGTVVHTVSVTDIGDGPGSDEGARIRNSLPAGARVEGVELSQGEWDGATGVWDTGPVRTGTGARLVLVLRVPESAADTELSGRSSFVSAPGNPPVVVGGCPDEPLASCAVTRVGGPPLTLRHEREYLVSVRNDNAATAFDVTAVETVPPGTVLLHVELSAGTYDAQSGLWRIGDLKSGGSATLRMSVVDQGVE